MLETIFLFLTRTFIILIAWILDKVKNFGKKLMLLHRYLKKLEDKGNHTVNSEDLKFYDLTPIDDSEEKACGKLLKFGLENEKVLNIAITGPYGSGKSSFLKSFESKNKDYNYLNISLASFDDSVGKDENTKNKIEKIIEENILQQIIYKESADKLPNSRIKRIKETSTIKFTMNFLLFFLWVNSFYLKFGKPVWWNKLINLNDFEKFNKLQSLILIFGVFYLVYFLAKNFGINKIIIKALNNEIELGNNKETSVFYKYLDEIIYFFKKTKYDVVFFEDIDRFENINVDLFTKLRELNGLLNNSADIKRDVKFVYAIKDDLFESGGEEKKEDSHKLRTKFFDLIVPIIPVVNYSNSREKLKEKLWDNYLENEYQNKTTLLQEELLQLNLEKQKSDENNEKEITNNLKIKISKIQEEVNGLKNKGAIFKDWIKKIAIYVDDMRIINNVVNEFVVYRENLNKVNSLEKLDDMKILGYIIYKNLYPKDFADLQMKKGLVYEGLKAKETYINRINSKILELKEKLNGMDEELFSDLEALRFYFIDKSLNDNRIITINNQSILHLIKNEEIFLSLRGPSNIGFNDGSFNRRNIIIDFNKYNERKDSINMKLSEVKDEITLEIKKLEKKNTEVEKYSVKSICKNNDVSEFFTSKLMNESLLVYLIEQGIIDEKEYYRYLSYFYEGELSPNDRDFLIALRGRKKDIEDYKLDNPKNVISELHIEDFERKEILNYNLMDEIIEKNNEYKQQFISIFSMINSEIDKILKKNNDEDTMIDFLGKYILKDTTKNKLVEKIIEEIPKYWNFMYCIKGNLTDKNIEDIFLKVFKYSKLEFIKKQNEFLSISEYLYNKENSLELLSKMYSIDEAKMNSFINELEIVVSKVNTENIIKEALSVNYTCNIENLRKVALFYCNNDEVIMRDFEIKNYSTIRNNQELWRLEWHVNSRFNEYVESVFLKLDNNTKEDLDKLLTILNEYDDKYKEEMDFNLSLEQKERIIKKQACVYPEVTMIKNKELWRVVFEENKTIPTWDNILEYFRLCGLTLDKALIKYLNNHKNIEELCNKKLSSFIVDGDEDLHTNLDTKIVLCSEIKEENFEILLKSLDNWSDINKINNISQTRMDLLIRNNKIDLTKTNINELIKNYNEKALNLISINKKKFIENPNFYLEYNEIEEKNIYTDFFNLLEIDEKLEFIKRFNMENLTTKDTLHPLLKEFIETITELSIFDSEKVKDLDTNYLLPFSNNVILTLNKIYGDKIETEGYFDYHKKKIVENIKELDLTARNYEILFDVLNNNKDKFELINNLKEETFKNYSILEKIFNFIEEEENEKIELAILERLMSKSSKENQLNIFLKQLDFLSTNEIKTILITLGDNYKKIVNNPTRNTFNENDVNIEILNKLKEKRIFSTVSEKNNKITVIKNQDLKW